MKRTVFVIMLIISTLTLGGCWDKKEVNELGWVMALGIDEGSEPGTFLVTYQIVSPKVGGEGAETTSWTISVEGKTIRETLDTLYTILYKQPFLGTMKMVVFGEEFARNVGLNKAVDFLQRNYALRLTMDFVVAKGKAKDILNAKTLTEQTTSLNLLLLSDARKKSSVAPNMKLEHYLPYIFFEKPGMVFPVVQVLKPSKEIQFDDNDGEKSGLMLKGGAVFSKDRLVDFLSDEETKGFMWLDDQIDELSLEVTLDSGETAVGNVHTHKSKYKVVDKDGVKGLKYKISAEVSLQEIHGERAMDLTEFKDFVERCEAKFEEEILKQCKAAIQKSKELKVDFLNVSRKIHQKYPKYWAQVKDQWESVLVEFPIEVEATTLTSYSGGSRNGPINAE